MLKKIYRLVKVHSWWLLLATGCGVKGDPLPPLTPAELGRGQPTYRRATEEIDLPELPPLREEIENDEEED